MRAVYMFVEELIKVMVRITVEFPVVEHFFYNQSQHSTENDPETFRSLDRHSENAPKTFNMLDRHSKNAPETFRR